MSGDLVTSSSELVPAPTWDGDGDPAEAVGNPRRDIRVGAAVAILFFVLFLGWAAFARIDAAAYAQGTLAVVGERQAVQHREGGVVGDIFVHEGDRVTQGQLLIRLAAADVRAQERALRSQAIRLLAQRARLQAEELGATRITPPGEFATMFAADAEEAQTALRLQQIELNERSAVLHAQQGALGRRSAEAQEQGVGFSRQVDSAEEQLRLIDQELAALGPLAARGFVSGTRLREVERQRAELVGSRGQYSAGRAQTEQARGESQLQSIEAERTYRERTASDLREVETTLGDILPRLAAARDQLARTEIRAPATGQVVGLNVFTPGGVIAPGAKLMDIIPERRPLIIEARVSPDDADNVRAGQAAIIRFQSIHDRGLPNIEGRVTQVSADRLVDEHTQQSYYTAQVTVPYDQLNRIAHTRGGEFQLRAGMPVEVLVPLRPRTVLQYLFDPLIGSFWRSFREH